MEVVGQEGLGDSVELAASMVAFGPRWEILFGFEPRFMTFMILRLFTISF